MQSKQYFTKIKNYPHEKSTEPVFQTAFFLKEFLYTGKKTLEFSENTKVFLENSKVFSEKMKEFF